MSLTDHVQLSITVDNVGITRAGFGVPLVVSANASFAERVRFYNSTADVIVDFPVTTSPEYLAAAAIFAQSPRPPKIAIGRAANKPTQKFEVSTVAVRNTYKYQLKVKGQGVTATTVEFTTDGTATDAEICAGLVTALNAVVGRNYLAAGATSPVTITGTAPGNWFSVEVVNVLDLSVAQTHVDPGIAADLAAIALADSSWYCLLTNYNSSAMVTAAAAWVESNKRIYVFDSNDTAGILNAAGLGELLDAQKTIGNTRTMGAYHPDPSAMLSAAWMGRWLPTEPGQATAKFKTLAGVAPVTLTATHKTNLRAKRANSYETIAGRPITWEGSVFSSVYAFLDVRRDVDWLDDDMTKSVFGVLAGSDKVPYTSDGIAIIEGAVRGSVARAVTQGVLAADTTSVEVPAIASVSPADKTSRTLRNVKFAGTLSGAVHSVIPINGVVSF